MGTVSAGRAEGAGRTLPYTPDYAVAPGETLEEALEELGMSQSEFARRTGRPEKTINEIVKGKAAITAETATQFERVTGIEARLWLNLESNYRSALARQDERERLHGQVGWLDAFPYGALVRRGLIRDASDPVDQLIEALRFFGVASVEAWQGLWKETQAAYHHAAAFTSEDVALAAWLRCGEIAAQDVDCVPFGRPRFLQVLHQIRAMTPQKIDAIWDSLVELCASAGVALVFTRELPGTHVSGSARWLNPQKAIIQLSLRYLSDDQLWFAFFHEGAHIVLHGKRERFLSTDREEGSPTPDAEEEASRWAVQFLIPPRDLEAFIDRGAFDNFAIRTFAVSLGIAPGIVVGQLQHRKLLPFHRGNQLKQRYRWASAEE